MRTIELPPEFQRFNEIGGVLEFAVFEDTQSDRESALAAICAAVPGTDKNKLRVLGCRSINYRVFHGDWYDPETTSLLRLGNYTTLDGRTLTDPRLRDLEAVQIAHGSSWVHDSTCRRLFSLRITKARKNEITKGNRMGTYTEV